MRATSRTPPAGPRAPAARATRRIFETCRLIVGFSADGRGAEAIECHWREGGVLGQRANAGYLVEKEGGRRVTSRLHDRIAHLKDRAMREIAERVARAARTDGPSELQIEGKVIGRDGHRLMIRGKARPAFGGSSAEPGVVTSESDLVVEYPSDDALRPGYYFAGEHCFKDKREKLNSAGLAVTEWTYGPCALGSEQYWMFEQYPPAARHWSTVRTRSTANASGIDGRPRRARRLRPWAVTVRGRPRPLSA